MFNRIIISAFTIIFNCICVFAVESVSMADSAYNEGNYQKAIEIYSDIATNQGVSAPLLFNLGNAYYNSGDLGNAMLCYQRAKKLDPANKMINSNLKFLAEKISDANKAEQHGKRRKVTEDEPNFFQNIHKKISEDTSSNVWSGWAAAFFIIFAGAVALYLYSSNVLLKKSGFFGGMICLGLSMVFLVTAYIGASAYDSHEYGVVIAYKVNLLTEPDKPIADDQEDVLTRGTKLRIIAQETDANGEVTWYKVRLNSDYIGWVPATEIAVI